MAGEPFTIEFDNRDEGTQHNIEIFTGPDPSGDTLFEGELVTGPDQVQYDVPALDAGEFAFNCVVHRDDGRQRPGLRGRRRSGRRRRR